MNLHILTKSTRLKLAACVSLVVLADVFFYGSGANGSIVGVYLLLLAGLVTTANASALRSRGGKWLAGLAAGQGVAAFLSPTCIGIALCLALLIGFGLKLADGQSITTLRRFYSMLRYLLRGWFRFPRDLKALYRATGRIRQRNPQAYRMLVWLMPVIFSVAFLWLFSKANPLLDQWLSGFNWYWVGSLFSFRRVGFWLFISAGTWALLRPRMKQRQCADSSHMPHYRSMDQMFAVTSLTVSLLLFNAMFLLQNLMDIAYLWSGAALPEGMTHAAYAHRGAYPLIATSVLAALFVLLALRPGSEGERSPTIRALVYAWIGQNIFLVFSSILRLLGYIEAYSLTGWRVAALLWMGLVACGLALILLRLYHSKSGEWLIRANLLCAFVLLYAVPFINIDRMIADYNVRHCVEVTGEGSVLDQYYLYQLGVQAIPAMQWYAEYTGENLVSSGLESQLEFQLSNWRRWTVRAYLLSLALSEGKREE